MKFNITKKFSISTLIALLWLLFCTWFSIPWLNDLRQYTGLFLAIFIISFIALIPGFMQMFLFISNIFVAREVELVNDELPPISILIAAYNEQHSILGTIYSILEQEYPNRIEIIVSDDGSSDQTIALLESLELKNLYLIKNHHGGKAHALNQGLKHVSNHLIIGLDADTFLAKHALKEIVEYYLANQENLAAVAGSVFVKNTKNGFMPGIQYWDFFQSISAVKRMQGLYGGTLVAQGAFSLYRKDVLQAIGGWRDCIGEDIVLSWNMLNKDYKILYCERAICFTNSPNTYKKFFYQRSRWSRGMLESFKNNPGILKKSRLTTFFIYWNLLFPIIDFCYLFIFIPGIVLAFLGHYFIAGPFTLALIPLSIIYNFYFYRVQHKIFKNLGIRHQFNFLTFIAYIISYHLLMLPACIHGYVSEFLHFKKRWS